MWLNEQNAYRERRGHEISHVLKLIFLLLTGTTYVLKSDGLYSRHNTQSPAANSRQPAEPAERGHCSASQRHHLLQGCCCLLSPFTY